MRGCPAPAVAAALAILAGVAAARAEVIKPVGSPIPVAGPFTDYASGAGVGVALHPTDGSFLVAWPRYVFGDGTGWALSATRFAGSDRRLSTERLNPDATGSLTWPPRAVIDPAGRATVVWDAAAVDAPHAIWGRRLPADDAATGGEAQLSGASGSRQEGVDLSVARNGTVAAAWVDVDTGRFWVQLFDAAGSRLLGHDLEVASEAGGASTGVPAIAVDPDGAGLLVAWPTRGGASATAVCAGPWAQGVVAQRYTLEGEAVGGRIALSQLQPGGLRLPQARLAGLGAGAFVAVWPRRGCAERTPSEVWGRIVSADGSTGEPFRIAASGGAPNVAADASGRFVVSWSTAAGSFARRFDRAGEALSDPTPIPGNGALAADADGGFVVAWEVAGSDPADRYPDWAIRHRFLAQRFSVVRRVSIEVRPGSPDRAVHLGSTGVVPVAILSDEGFDATTVDPASVRLAGARARLRHDGTPVSQLADVDDDGRPDLLVAVEARALELGPWDTSAALEARTRNGRRVEGEDTVHVLPE